MDSPLSYLCPGRGRIHYVDWAVDYCKAYNSWLYEKFTKDNPSYMAPA